MEDAARKRKFLYDLRRVIYCCVIPGLCASYQSPGKVLTKCWINSVLLVSV